MQNVDDRLSKEIGANRQSRGSEDRHVTQNRELTEADRLEMFRTTIFQDALPDLPEIPGYHVCWLTTTNPRDTVHRRMRLGYTPVLAEDVAGFFPPDSFIKGGQFDGMIAVNEMVAMKIATSLYLKFMQEAHHDAPLREEEGLKSRFEEIAENVTSAGGRIDAGDGIEDMGKFAPSAGKFAN